MNALFYFFTIMSRKRVFHGLKQHFDADWYLNRNTDVGASGMDPFQHFVKHGWEEGRDPSRWFSIVSYVREHPELFPKPQSKTQYRKQSNKTLDHEYIKTQREIAQSYSSSETLIIFFNVALDVIGGGMLSINRFVACAQEIYAEGSTCGVAMSGVPLSSKSVEFTHFKAAAQQVEFKFLVEETDPETVKIFVPENFSLGFVKSLSDQEMQWLHSRKNFKLFVLNQNEQLMPSPTEFKDTILSLTKNVVITTAHSRYCTSRTSARYLAPVKQLTPILPIMKYRTLGEKERIILLSPDPIDQRYKGVTREQVLIKLRAELPDFEFVTVQNLSLDAYLDLASRAMFSLTFGEGLDGYFIEPVLSGGVSFAIFNSVFFPESFASAKTIFLSWDLLIEQLPPIVRRLSQSEESYENQTKMLQSLLSQEYSYERSKHDMTSLFEDEVDHNPTPWLNVSENFLNIKTELERNHGFRFTSLPQGLSMSGGLRAAITPDDLYILHLGGEFYSVLYEVYVLKDYDLDLQEDCEYILIDIGANFGLVSLYLSKKYPQIKACHAYEPAEPTARLAKKNIEFNTLETPIDLKLIGLSDCFKKSSSTYIADWSTAFSTDDKTLETYLQDSTAHRDEPVDIIEFEVVPAHTEIGPIVRDRGSRKIVVKCDTQGSEFAVVSDLESSGLLGSIDIFIIESHFHDPSKLLEQLRISGFEVRSRLDSEINQVFTIYAYRH
jgi:FkbM family methyltransferase